MHVHTLANYSVGVYVYISQVQSISQALVHHPRCSNLHSSGHGSFQSQQSIYVMNNFVSIIVINTFSGNKG